ncbi:MAG: ABC transporter substrate-binding protein [Chloroflexia bacterium]|nr:ABC transporter substrate-binding protein [Chloroflexia bacterium]
MSSGHDDSTCSSVDERADTSGRGRAGLNRRRFLQTTAALTAAAGGSGAGIASPGKAAAAAAQESIEEVIVALGADTRVMDPDLDQGLNDMYRLIFNTPLSVDDEGLPVADLAESWEFADDTTLRLMLRQDAVWQDGEPLTADDFVFTWERMNDPERESTNVQGFSPWLADVIAIDDYTVEMRTSVPYAPALVELDGFWIAPRHFIEEVGDEAFGLKPLGSGPYQVVEWQKDQFLSLEAASTWWGEPQPFPRVRFVIIPDTFTRAAALLAGDAHVVSEPPVAMVPQIEGSGTAYVTQAPDWRIQFIQFPHQDSRRENTPEIDNKLVRQALNYALDREAIATAVGQGNFDVVPGPWFGSSWAYPANAAELGYRYDPERARELLAEAGYADGFTFYFGTSNGFSLMDNELMQACVPYFQDIGLQVEFTSLEWAAFDPARDENQFSAYYLGLSGSTDPHGSPNQYMTSQGRTRGFYDTDPELEEVIWQGATIVDFEERQTYYQEVIFPMMIDVAPWIFLWTPSSIMAVDNRIEYQQGPQPYVEVMKMTAAG